MISHEDFPSGKKQIHWTLEASVSETSHCKLKNNALFLFMILFMRLVRVTRSSSTQSPTWINNQYSGQVLESNESGSKLPVRSGREARLLSCYAPNYSVVWFPTQTHSFTHKCIPKDTNISKNHLTWNENNGGKKRRNRMKLCFCMFQSTVLCIQRLAFIKRRQKVWVYLFVFNGTNRYLFCLRKTRKKENV